MISSKVSLSLSVLAVSLFVFCGNAGATILFQDNFQAASAVTNPSTTLALPGPAQVGTWSAFGDDTGTNQGVQVWNNVDPAKVYQRKGAIAVTLVDKNQREAFVEQEASRCLDP